MDSELKSNKLLQMDPPKSKIEWKEVSSAVEFLMKLLKIIINANFFFEKKNMVRNLSAF